MSELHNVEFCQEGCLKLFRWVYFSLLLGTITLSIAKSDADDIENLIRDENYTELRTEIRRIQSSDENYPSVLFAKGLISENAQKAIEYYNDIVQNHHNSKYADDALFRLGQYHYSQGSYDSARKYFSLLSRHFPSSKYKDESQYLYCQCFVAQGSLDSAKVFLTAFIKNVSKSPYIDFAIMDLEELSTFQANAGMGDLGTNLSRFNYSIQVGAFSDRKNAVKFSEMLSERKIVADIVSKQIGNRQLWAVWIGKYQTKEKAKEYAERYLKRIFDDYQIVDINN